MFKEILRLKRGFAACLFGAVTLFYLFQMASGGLSADDALPGLALAFGMTVLLYSSARKAVLSGAASKNQEYNGIRLDYPGVHVPRAALDEFDESGELPDLDNTPVILEQGERAVYFCDATVLEVKNRVVGYTGGGAGVSVRVAKGVSLRTGGSQRQAVRGDVKLYHEGRLVITSKRIVFLSSDKPFEIKLGSLAAVEEFSDGISIQSSRTNYSLLLSVPQYPAAIIRRVKREM